MHPDEYEELHGDGYRNESQRCLAEAYATRINETAKAEELARNGRVIVLCHRTHYCRATDAVAGDDIFIAGNFDNDEDAEHFVSVEIERCEGEDGYNILSANQLKIRAEMEAALEAMRLERLKDDPCPF